MPAGRADVPAGADPGLNPRAFVVTCEHGGNEVEAAFRPWFEGWEEVLDSHRGYDAGALDMARDLADALGAPLVAATTSRLVVDLNRSPGHPRLHSEALRKAPPELRARAFDRHYLPYRRQVEKLVAEAAAAGLAVVHISSHSFTPVLDGRVRKGDIGLLYDPRRPGEVTLARRWLAALKMASPPLLVRRNYPYSGKSDGLCSSLRRHYGPAAYVGMELEINQKLVLPDAAAWDRLRRHIVASLLSALHP